MICYTPLNVKIMLIKNRMFCALFLCQNEKSLVRVWVSVVWYYLLNLFYNVHETEAAFIIGLVLLSESYLYFSD